MTLETYRSDILDYTYPFASHVPFDLGLIQSMRFALKRCTGQLYVTRILCQPGSFKLRLSSQDQVLGDIQYSGNQWITVDNEDLFGFIKLAVQPSSTFSYEGKWPLHKGAYTYAIDNGGLRQLNTQNGSIINPDYIELQVSGDLQISTDPIQAQFTGGFPVLQSNKVYIRRTEDALNTYAVIPQAQRISIDKVIKTVNTIPANHLVVTSSVNSITVQAPVQVANGLYVMYVSTEKGFPTCQRQQYESDSESDAN